LNRRLGGPSSLDVSEKGKMSFSYWDSTMDHPACSLVAEGIVSPWSITDMSINGCSSHLAKYTSKHAIQLHFIASHPAHYSTQSRAVLEREFIGFWHYVFGKAVLD
jgi:hypothetical protein